MSYSNSNSAGVSMKQPFTAEETTYYKNTFSSLDKEQLNIVTGDALKTLFIESGISNDLLAVIWSLADYDNKGFLTFDQFGICCRLIGYIQSQGGSLSKPLSENDYQVFVKIPDFSGKFKPSRKVSRQASFILNRKASNASLQSNNNTQIPLPTPQEIGQFNQLYDSCSKGQPVISGDDAREILQKSKLPTQALVEIWNLADQNDLGYLTKEQFIIAMFLVQLLMSNRVGLPLPDSLQPSIWNFVKQNVSQSQMQQRVASPLQRNTTNNSFSNVPVDQWALNPESSKNFDAIFASLDKGHQGKLGSDVLVPYFMESGLSQDTLAVIWDLSDINNNAEFTNVEFSIAMFLIQKTNSGIELPDIVPQSLLNSSLALHGKADGSNNGNQFNGNSPSIPNRNSKPSFESSQPTSRSPLNDLMTLDNTGFSSPNTTGNNNGLFAPIPVNNAPNPNVTPVKKFKPSSTFGQSIIPEEQEPVQPPAISKSATGTQSPLRYNYTSNLPAVPNFASISSPVNQRSVSVDNSTSMAISNATTDIANLSTQTRSLSNQTKMAQDRKQRSEQELAKILSTKASIEQRLSALRQAYATETALAEEAEKQVQEITAETSALEQEAQVLETNYNTVKEQHDIHNNALNVAMQKNNELKQRLANINSNNEMLTKDLDFKKQEMAKHEGLVSVTGKQLEVSELSSDKIQNEIALIEQHFTSFLSKKSELDDYQKNLEEQHGLMQSRHGELEEAFQALNSRQQDLEQKTAEITKQEEIYNENVKRLQEMFADFQVQQQRLDEEREILEENEMKLENDRNDYLERVHAYATQDLDVQPVAPVAVAKDIPKTEVNVPAVNKNIAKDIPKTDVKVPEVSKNIVKDIPKPDVKVPEVSKSIAQAATIATKDIPKTDVKVPEVSKSIAQVATIAAKDIPKTDIKVPEVSKSIAQSEGAATQVSTDLEKLTEQANIHKVVGNMDDVPVHQSNTSSLVNNGSETAHPAAVLDEIKEHEPIDKGIPGEFHPVEKSIYTDKSTVGEHNVATEQDIKEIPEKPPKDITEPSIEKMIAHENASFAGSPVVKAKSVDAPVKAAEVVGLPITGPVSHVEFPPIREIEQDESDSSDDESDEVPVRSTAAKIIKPDSFDDFDGLEAAQVEDDEDSDAEVTVSKAAPTKASNPEWDAMFQGLEKQKPAVPAKDIPHKMVVSPKDLAIEELIDMGFSEKDSISALEKFNWHLESAAQYLITKN